MTEYRIKFFPSDRPWRTWHLEFYSNTEKIKFTDREPDLYMIDWEEGIESLPTPDKPLIVYCEQPEEFSNMIDLLKKYKNKSMVLTEQEKIYRGVNLIDGLKSLMWSKPTRIPRRRYFGKMNRGYSGGFITISNASREEDKIEEIIKTYFGMCLYETEDGEMLSNFDFDIFSAQELPVEPFNSVIFHGLQPNPIVFNCLERSKLFISPYNGDSVSQNIVDAIMVGTPVLMRNTKANRLGFITLNDDCFFDSTKELAKKIKVFKELPESELKAIAARNFRNLMDMEIYDIDSATIELHKLIEEELIC